MMQGNTALVKQQFYVHQMHHVVCGGFATAAYEDLAPRLQYICKFSGTIPSKSVKSL